MWGGLIAAIKSNNQLYSLARYKKCVFPHTTLNRATGLLLYIAVPFSFHSMIPMTVTAVIATIASLHEGIVIKKSQAQDKC